MNIDSMPIEQVFNVSFDTWSILFSLVLAIGVLMSYKHYPKQANPLIGMMITNAVLNAAEVYAYLYRGDPSQLGFWIVRVSNFIVFLANHVLLVFVSVFVFRTIEKNGQEVSRAFKMAITFVIGVGIALLVLSRVFGFYYAFDSENRYYRLGSYWVMFLLEMLAMVMLAVLTFKYRKRLTTAEKISFALFVTLPIIATVAQLFTYGFSLTTFATTISLTLVFIAYEKGLSNEVVAKERRMLGEVIAALAQAVDAKDTYTNGHSARVARYSGMLAEKLGLSQGEIDDVVRMATLHDVGKIGVPDNVLNKSAKLTGNEYKLIQCHTVRGDEILAGIESLPKLHIGARWHHERYDGSGYPDGLAGTDIPLEARIIGVADSYDAMTSDRVYREHLPQGVVRREIMENIGTQFDPDVAWAMLEIIDEDPDYELHG